MNQFPAWLSRWFMTGDTQTMSRAWKTEQQSKAARVEFHGVTLKQWPVKKLVNEGSPRMNAERLRKRA